MKNALITGATKGIGRAIACALAKEGLSLAICSRNLKDLEQTKVSLQEINPSIKVFISKADVASKTDLLRFAQSAEEDLGVINVVINNAAGYQPNLILEDTDDAFSVQINANLRPAYDLYRYFGAKMALARSGHFFNICSVAAKNPVVNAGMYSVTKASTLSLSNIMRLEMQQYGVKVTSVIPGSTLTSSWDGVDTDAAKFVLPEDIAAAVVTIYNMSAGANVDEITIAPVFGQL